MKINPDNEITSAILKQGLPELGEQNGLGQAE